MLRKPTAAERERQRLALARAMGPMPPGMRREIYDTAVIAEGPDAEWELREYLAGRRGLDEEQ